MDFQPTNDPALQQKQLQHIQDLLAKVMAANKLESEMTIPTQPHQIPQVNTQATTYLN